MWNKVWMWNSFVTHTSREHPRLTEDCACAPRLHSHSENLFLVNFLRKDKKANWCFFLRSGINRKRCTPATTSLDTPSPKNMFSWQPSAYSRTCAAMVSSYKVYGCCCTSNGSLKFPFTAFLDAKTLNCFWIPLSVMHYKCLQPCTLKSEGYFNDVQGVCVLDGAYMCLASPTLYDCTVLGSASSCNDLVIGSAECKRSAPVGAHHQATTFRDKHIIIKLCFYFILNAHFLIWATVMCSLLWLYAKTTIHSSDQIF